MFMLNPRSGLILKKKTLFIVHQQRQQSTAAPQPITVADPPPRRPPHQSIDPRQFTTSDTDQHQVDTTRDISRFSASATKPASQNHQPQSPTNPSQPASTGDSPQQRQRNRSSSATVHSAIAFNSDNRSTHQHAPIQQWHDNPFHCTAGPKQDHKTTFLAPSPLVATTNYRR